MNTLSHWMAKARQRGLNLIESQCLMLKAMGQPQDQKVWLYTHDQTELTQEQHETFWAYVRRRLDHVPLAYITQESCFYGLPLKVDERALDPRPETEILVDWALEILREEAKFNLAHAHPSEYLLSEGVPLSKVLDLGCGSGAIALAIKANAPKHEVWGIDQSIPALALASLNAQALRLEIILKEGNWLSNVGDIQFDLIVSNPPYIAPEDPHLKLLSHEPRSALVSAQDGMGDILTIAQHSRKHLSAGAWLLFEHGHDQSERVHQTFQDLGYVNIQTRKDLSGIPRCTGAQSPKVG
jgi:release factor glutamine methyltransferase